MAKKEDIGFVATLDTTEFKKEADKLKKEAEKAAKSLENSMKRSTDNISNRFFSQGNDLKDLISDFKGMGSAGIATLGIAAAGTAIYAYGSAVMTTNREMQTFINTNGKMDEQAFLTAKNLQDQGYELKETAIAANALAKAYGVDLKTAYNLIQQSANKGADAQGQMLDMFKEYPTQMKNAGYSLEEFAALSISTQKAGLFSDKGIDAIKEANLSLREMGDAQIKALAPIEDSVEKRIKEYAALGKTKDALKLIGKEMQKNYLTTQQQQLIIADILKGAGEDAGRTLFTLISDPESFSKLKDLRTDLTKSSEEFNKSINELTLTLTKDGGLMQLSTDFGTSMVNYANETVSVWMAGFKLLKFFTNPSSVLATSEYQSPTSYKQNSYGTTNFINPNSNANDPLVQNMQGYKPRPGYTVPGAGGNYDAMFKTKGRSSKGDSKLIDKPINNIRELSINITKMVEKIEINNVEDTKKIEAIVTDMFRRIMLDIKPALKN